MPLHFKNSLAFVLGLALTGAFLMPTRAKADLIPERRDTPTKLDAGYLAFPVFSHIPGIGSTYGAGLLASNIARSRVNVYSVALIGDTKAAVFGVNEIHLIENTLIFGFTGYASQIPNEIHERGSGSPKENFFYLTKHEYGGSMTADLQFWRRRIQINSKLGASRAMPEGVSTSSGVGVNNADSRESDAVISSLGLTFDFTDDERDPRRGFNLQISRNESVVFDGLRSRFHTFDASATAYIPLPFHSVWAFNVFRSNSYVTNRNGLSAADLREKMSLHCDTLSDSAAKRRCEQSEDFRVSERAAENEHGTSALLGGPTQLRGFPLGRFRGSQSLFYATELRLNLSDENTKFDLGFIKGTRSFVQIAPFYELGAACDFPETIESAPMQSAYGVGFRFGFSGAIIRADAGFSREGSQFTFFVGYPWGMTNF